MQLLMHCTAYLWWPESGIEDGSCLRKALPNTVVNNYLLLLMGMVADWQVLS